MDKDKRFMHTLFSILTLAPLLILGAIAFWLNVYIYVFATVVISFYTLIYRAVKMVPELDALIPSIWSRIFSNYHKIIYGIILITWSLGSNVSNWTWKSLMSVVICHFLIQSIVPKKTIYRSA